MGAPPSSRSPLGFLTPSHRESAFVAGWGARPTIMRPHTVVVKHTVVAEGGAASGSLPLGPYDLYNKGRSVPMTWLYDAPLDVDALLLALRHVLGLYPCLCGRYDGLRPPSVKRSS